MKREDINRIRFGITQTSHFICDSVAHALENAKSKEEIDYCVAQAEAKLLEAAQSHIELKESGDIQHYQIEEQEDILGFTSILTDSLAKFSQFTNQRSHPIHFHVYH